MRLEGEAKKAGGRVHALLGNHEVMNVLGDLRYVSREEYKAFETPRSRETWETLYRSRANAARQAAKEAKQPFDEAAFRQKFEADVAARLRRAASRRSRTRGATASGCASVAAMVMIDGSAFLHGGLTPEVAALGCEAINATVRREITSDIAKTRLEPLASLAAGDNGPFWYRGMAREDETAVAAVARAGARGRSARSAW